MATNREKLALILRLAAPYLAVAIFWCWLSSGWLAILAYHAQALLWGVQSGVDRRPLRRPVLLLLALPCLVAGPVLWVLLPYITRTNLVDWLASYGLAGASLTVMVPYFGLVHPMVEQHHWAALRAKTPLAHVLFAGYHVLVLYSLLTLPWLLVCVAVLAAASAMWEQLTRSAQSLWPAVLSHVLADFGVVAAAWWVVRGIDGV